MTKELKNGLWPVMITPFKEDGAIDWDGLEKVTEWYIENGATGLFANCLSSEMYFLEPKEMLELVQRIVEICEHRVQVLAAGTFGADLEEKVEFCEKISDTGVDAVVAINCLMAQENDSEVELKKNYETLLNSTGDIAFGLYECPKPYHRLLSPQMTGWLARSDRFLYLKETSRSPEMIKRKVEAAKGTPLKVFNAHAPSGLESLRLGASGLSCIAANLYPDLFAWLCANWQEQPEEATKLQSKLALLDRTLRVNYPKSAKSYMKKIGINISDTCRIPNLNLDLDDEIILTLLAEEIQGIREGKL